MNDAMRDLQEALRDLADALTEALHVEAVLDWMGRMLERAGIDVW